MMMAQVIHAGQNQSGRDLGPPVAQEAKPGLFHLLDAAFTMAVELVVAGNRPDTQGCPQLPEKKGQGVFL